MYRIPPVINNEYGKSRKIGFEIEFGNLDSYRVSGIISDLYGGELKETNRYFMKLENTSKGDFVIKIDTSFLYEKKYKRIFKKLGINRDKLLKHHDLVNRLEEVLEGVFSSVIPYEVAAPPVGIESLDSFDPLIDALRENRATGTSESAVNAFATHINAELPVLSLTSILDYLKAFLLLYPWLFDEMNIELSRRISSFINPFPDKYIHLVLNNDYHPDKDKFISDYHEYNADRNRPLDLYPVLASLDPKVVQLEKIGNVKPRPTLHFRLPNSRIDDPDWSLATEWNYWWYVENLASNKKELHQLIEEYRDLRSSSWFGLERKWKNRISDWTKGISS